MNEVDYFARFDGACWPNPGGKAAAACVIYQGPKPVFRQSQYLGKGPGQTNNVAEFSGLLLILEWLKTNHPAARAVIYSDSQIVVRRMNSRTLPSGCCRPVAEKCLVLIRELYGVRLAWQKRSFNEECDELCSAEITKAGDSVPPDPYPSRRNPWRKHERDFDEMSFWE